MHRAPTGTHRSWGKSQFPLHVHLYRIQSHSSGTRWPDARAAKAATPVRIMQQDASPASLWATAVLSKRKLQMLGSALRPFDRRAPPMR